MIQKPKVETTDQASADYHRNISLAKDSYVSLLPELISEIRRINLVGKIYSYGERVTLEDGLLKIIDGHTEGLKKVCLNSTIFSEREISCSLIEMSATGIFSRHLSTAVKNNLDYIYNNDFADITKLMDENGKMARSLSVQRNFGYGSIYELIFAMRFYLYTDRYSHLMSKVKSTETPQFPARKYQHSLKVVDLT